ncbi:MAG: 16S rRNA (cytosine(1402)-N(4))-methyltransferase RsmH [Bacteroidetes bacterium]|nr:16S rRNA (cytosine(1402)-N(4))-methyltransferase RsmH [Bacteroidota bacterium]
MVKTTEAYHLPVMLNECIKGLEIKKDGIYVDVTFGGGGHSKEILKHLGEHGKLYAFDQDSDAAQNLPDDPRLVFIQHNFRYIRQFLEFLKAVPVNGILADLGISSYQINKAEKGFAHRLAGDLDMRMDQKAGLKASDVLNQYGERELLKIFNQYGEVKNAYKLVQTILEQRKSKPIVTIDDFKTAIKTCIPAKEESKYLSQVFQALRIEVNQELKALESLLEHVTDLLAPGGRLVIMSYHSLEDRLVKNFIQTGNIEGELKKDLYGRTDLKMRAITKKPIVPTDKEIEENKRARSAKLRIAEKI